VTTGLPGLGSDAWTEIAEGPGETIVAAIPGKGLFYGRWQTGTLQMQPACLPANVDAARLGRSSLASCTRDRRFMYAVSSDSTSDPPI